MKTYEGLFIFATGSADSDLVAEVTSWITKFEGSVSKTEDLGIKKITHSSNKHNEGKTLVVEFEILPENIASLRKDLELKENLIRYMITHYQEKPQAPKYIKKTPQEEEVTA